MRKHIFALFCAGTFATASLGQVQVLVDHVGYETHGPKQALIEGTERDHPEQFLLIDAKSGKEVLSGKPAPAGEVKNWGRWFFWKADFSSWQTPGQYVLEIRTGQDIVRSCPFEIEDDLLERSTLSNVIYYFKGQRSSGAFDRADRHLSLPGGQPGFVDVHGGWYDATGDYGIHLSQLDLTAYFNNQQVPLVAWTLLKGYRILQSRNNDNFSEYERRMLDEGLFGADFLVRMKRPGGSFFESISAPGKEKLAKDRAIGDPHWRPVIKTSASDFDTVKNVGKITGPHAYEVSFRSGGGVAIAALALASTMPDEGDFSHAQYLKAAEDAFAFLSVHNRELLDNHKENILDDYCALLAATELYKATHKEQYLAAANRRSANLTARLITNGQYHDYWRADDEARPFFHPSDAGLPVIALLEYMQIASRESQKQVLDTVKRSLQFELAATNDVNNPFGYARQLVRMGNGNIRTAFFFPHDTDAAPWWQGENARIASMAAAARMAAPFFADDPKFQSQLEDYAWNQLHWILGRNPFDACMLNGSGHGNVPYMFFLSYKYTSAPGSIVNGITAAIHDEDGIAFNEGYAQTGKDDDWRWSEQWLPHAAWYLYAMSLPH